MKTVIKVKNVQKTYDKRVILKQVDLEIKKGEIVALLGRNGAGKSTLLNVLLQLVSKDQGEIEILGEKRLKTEAIGVMLQNELTLERTTVKEILELWRSYYPKSKSYAELLTIADLEEKQETFIAKLSGGQRRSLQFALCLAGDPEVIFLDEPTVGMDIQSRMRMWDMLLKIRDHFGTTIFLTTHYLEEADQLSDTICIMKDGKDVIQGTPLQLRSLIHQDSLQIQFLTQNEVQECLPLFQQLFVGRSVFARNKSIIVNIQNSHSDMEKAMSFLLENHIPCQSIQIIQPTLEDVFLRLTTKKEQEVKKENECLSNITQKY